MRIISPGGLNPPISPPSGYVPKIEFSERKLSELSCHYQVVGSCGLHGAWLPVLVDFLLQYAPGIENGMAL